MELSRCYRPTHLIHSGIRFRDESQICNGLLLESTSAKCYVKGLRKRHELSNPRIASNVPKYLNFVCYLVAGYDLESS